MTGGKHCLSMNGYYKHIMASYDEEYGFGAGVDEDGYERLRVISSIIYHLSNPLYNYEATSYQPSVLLPSCIRPTYTPSIHTISKLKTALADHVRCSEAKLCAPAPP